MNFWIQASNPRHTGQRDPDDETIGEAIETAFPLLTESATLVWHHNYIALNYKYDIGVIINDLTALLYSILRNPSGLQTVEWPSSTFRTRWTVRWTPDELSIDAEWLSIVGASENVVNMSGPVTLSTPQFVAEWKQVLGKVVEAVQACGYDATRIDGMSELVALHARIDGSGILYG